MESEAALARKHLDALPLRAPLAARMRELLDTETRGEPEVHGKRLFFVGQGATQDKGVLFERGIDEKNHVVVDPNTWPTKDNPSLQAWWPSHDGGKVAYAVSLHNGDESTLHVLDIATGRESPNDVIANLDDPETQWTPDGKGFYYRYMPPHVGGERVSDRLGLVEIRHHTLGDDPAHDARVHDKTGDPTLWLDPEISDDGHWLFATVDHGHIVTEISFRDLRHGAKREASHDDTKAWTILTGLDHGASSVISAFHDRFYLLTNDGASNWRIVAVDPAHPDHASWKEIVPERKDARLESARVIGGKLVLKYFKDVVTHVEVHGLDGALVREIPLPDIGTASIPSGEENGDDAYLSFSSFTHPPEIEHVSIARGTSEVWFRENVPADMSPYVTEQVFFPSKDGTRVPMFIVRAKDVKRDGSAPLMLGGYGGFDITYASRFSRSAIPWLEHGGTYVWVSLRGGGEYGEAWHRAGMGHQKQNVFDDYTAAAEYLVHEGYTRSDRLVGMGRSNGGLLMGAVTTQRPDLFRAILCGAPVLDMMRFSLVGSGQAWVEEYGDVNVEADFRTLLAYSPVHNVKAGVRYPSFLMLSPANDDRVDPMHARKLVAELQAASTGGPVLLRVERESGHAGADSRAALANYWGDMIAFALAEVGKVGATMTGP
jgi:prolyl oligopeptidase